MVMKIRLLPLSVMCRHESVMSPVASTNFTFVIRSPQLCLSFFLLLTIIALLFRDKLHVCLKGAFWHVGNVSMQAKGSLLHIHGWSDLQE